MFDGLDLSHKLAGLSICSGVGGLEAALERWVAPIAYFEFDSYAQGIILARIRDGRLPDAPIWDDLRTLRGNGLPRIDALYGGPPCQDFSLAGAGAGLEGDRGSLMLETLRLIGECRPLLVVLENVPGFILRGLDQVLLGFDALRYDCRWTVISAEEVGAPFLGERLFIVAKTRSIGYRDLDQSQCVSGSEGPSFARRDSKNLEMASPDRNGCLQGRTESNQRGISLNGKSSRQLETVGQAHRARLERARLTKEAWSAFSQHRHSGPGDWPHWLPEPALPRGHDGLRFRSHAIRCSGNGVVSLQAEEAFKRLIGIENNGGG